ncbi:MAG: IS630 family transposase, partial [Candidatus Thermoplasmatota archaeon]|nr:IS630 family transposase [Candidatus Thermoplasmatota archaeon]
MGRREIIPVQRKMSAEELEKRIKTLEKDTRVLKRLYFIRYRYQGDSVETAA